MWKPMRAALMLAVFATALTTGCQSGGAPEPEFVAVTIMPDATAAPGTNGHDGHASNETGQGIRYPNAGCADTDRTIASCHHAGTKGTHSGRHPKPNLRHYSDDYAVARPDHRD